MENIYDVELFAGIPAMVEENVQVWKFITISCSGCDTETDRKQALFCLWVSHF